MGTQIKVLQKGKITIPSDLRERLGVKEGDYLTLEIVDNKLVLLPPKTVVNPTDLLSGLVKGISVKEPVRGGLRKAGAVRVEKKLKRTANEVH